ncbi:MAG: class I SAM-dependent methyltransferase [Fidelibacterota bacterium]
MVSMIEKWEREEGVVFLRRIGLKSAHKVLDFGARVGHYSIPAALVVGRDGWVYALDKDRSALKELQRKAQRLQIKNIEIILTTGAVTLDLEKNSIDVVLLYDVLHYFTPEERKQLLSEVYRVLKPDGLLSIYPKHVMNDAPLDQFEGVGIADVRQEIVAANFIFLGKFCGTLSHDDFLNPGCVLNFSK